MVKSYGLANQKLLYIQIILNVEKFGGQKLKRFKEWLVNTDPGWLFPGTNDSHCDRIHSSLTAVRCFDKSYVGKQPVAWKKILCEVQVKRTPGKHG